MRRSLASWSAEPSIHCLSVTSQTGVTLPLLPSLFSHSPLLILRCPLDFKRERASCYSTAPRAGRRLSHPINTMNLHSRLFLFSSALALILFVFAVYSPILDRSEDYSREQSASRIPFLPTNTPLSTTTPDRQTVSALSLPGANLTWGTTTLANLAVPSIVGPGF